MLSLVIPVFKNEGSLPELVETLAALSRQLPGPLEPVFVVDGSPDASQEILARLLPMQPYASKLLSLSRNFGSFAAIRAGLAAATGPHFAVMAADLQEPPELVQRFFETLERGDADVVFGVREGRADPWLTRSASAAFWWAYRRLVQPEIPPGGIDVFACSQRFRDQVLRLEESNTSLVGLLCWLGFRRHQIPYRRLARRHGRSAWSLRRRLKYLLDSVFSFTDLPIRLLILAGGVGLSLSIAVSVVVFVAWALSMIEVPGYTPIILVVSLLGSLNLLSFGIIGSYVWRTFENTKRRPEFIVMEAVDFRPS